MAALEINSFKSVFPANLKDGSSMDFPLNSTVRVRGRPASVLRARWPTHFIDINLFCLYFGVAMPINAGISA
ncbi:hypothetical protein Agau_P100071 (plasmid) [Agrobacterium tumefaciens F2]|uniref:hypothetical protein n=1 Tax=Rhizobium oryzihabitans TaxID=2267833 RepID=UPI000216FECE|nr:MULTISPECIES: hypothetical protein [Rhizobium/Agrobacterium group]EGP54347.1 hypothetical protein Agau_P100071 [Agrobacterium tumefaciens F2]